MAQGGLAGPRTGTDWKCAVPAPPCPAPCGRYCIFFWNERRARGGKHRATAGYNDTILCKPPTPTPLAGAHQSTLIHLVDTRRDYGEEVQRKSNILFPVLELPCKPPPDRPHHGPIDRTALFALQAAGPGRIPSVISAVVQWRTGLGNVRVRWSLMEFV